MNPLSSKKSHNSTWKKIRNSIGGLSALQAKIMLIRGYTSEAILLRQRHFVEQLKLPKSTIGYNVAELKRKGYLTGLNFLTPDGKVVFQTLKRYVDNTRKLRGHKIFGTFILIAPYADFELVRNSYLKISKSPRHRGFRVEFEGCIVLFYTATKICFYLPDVYGNSISEIYADAYERYIAPLKSYLEQIFKGLRINEYEIASVTINHLAYQNHPLAEIFRDFNAQYASDRIEVDHSHGVSELETVHKKHSVEDMDKILDYEELVRGSFSCNKAGKKKGKKQKKAEGDRND